MFDFTMSHLIFLLLTPIHMCAHFVDCCPLGSYVGIDQVGQPCHGALVNVPVRGSRSNTVDIHLFTCYSCKLYRLTLPRSTVRLSFTRQTLTSTPVVK